MFKVLKNITKATVAAVITPVALAADVITMPASAYDNEIHPFKRTAKRLKAVGDNIREAIDHNT